MCPFTSLVLQGPLAAQVQLGSEEALSFQAFSPPAPSQPQDDEPPEADSAARSPQRAPSGGGQASSSPWAPQGILLAHLAEHTRAVNQLAVLQVRSELAVSMVPAGCA